MAHIFWLASALAFSFIGIFAYFWTPALALLVIAVPLFFRGVLDTIQTRQAVKRNFPVVGHLR